MKRTLPPPLPHLATAGLQNTVTEGSPKSYCNTPTLCTQRDLRHRSTEKKNGKSLNPGAGDADNPNMSHQISTLRRSVAVTAVALVLSSCGTAQRVDMGSPAESKLSTASEETLTVARTPEITFQTVPRTVTGPRRATEADTLVDEPTAEESAADEPTDAESADERGPGEIEHVLDALALETKEEQGSEAVDPREVLRAASEDDLVEELEQRVLKAWEIVAESPDTAGLDDEYAELRHQTATRLLALTFLRNSTGDVSHAALTNTASRITTTAQGLETPAEYRLLAAAHVAKSGGPPEQIAALVGPQGAAKETPPIDADDTGATTSGENGFRVVRMTFARAIEGPGEFCTLPSRDVKPGKTVYIYGEFENFDVQTPEETKADSRLCAFSAAFELVDEENAIVEELEFLSEKHGRQRVSTSTETVNFWARYRIPDGLEPGLYHLRIRAMDRIGNATALSQLRFAVEG